MPFIGIISDENIEKKNIKKYISEKLNIKKEQLIDISEKNILNIKNIKFETVVITRDFKNNELIKTILKDAKYIIINSDLDSNLKLVGNMESRIITYGFNSKATVTASSVNDEEIFLCIQRNVKGKNNMIIEPQELKVDIVGNVNYTMAIYSLLLIYEKIIL